MNIPQLLYALKDQAKGSDEVEFFGHCVANINHSRSQNFQDVWALYENKFKLNGYFVEFGATNGFDGSNSYLLQSKYLWSGILAEPNPVWHNNLKKNRENIKVDIITDCVYTETGKELEFLAVKDADLSTIKGFGTDDEHSAKRQDCKTIKVNTISLIDMLDKYGAPEIIDYMSVDTEGSEHDILKAYFDNPNNKDYCIKCITVEHNFNFESRQKLQDLMIENGYLKKFEAFSRWDDFYVRVA